MLKILWSTRNALRGKKKKDSDRKKHERESGCAWTEQYEGTFVYAMNNWKSSVVYTHKSEKWPVWTGWDEGYDGRGKDCLVQKSVHRIVWPNIGIMAQESHEWCVKLVSIYAPVNIKLWKENVREEFWKKLNEQLRVWGKKCDNIRAFECKIRWKKKEIKK